jgi:uncharacterized protein YkwD
LRKTDGVECRIGMGGLMRAKAWMQGLGIAWIFMGACAEGSDYPLPSDGCVPGALASCVCPNGAPSAQICEPGGTSFGACDCGAASPAPGAAGTPGTAGSAGTAGMPIAGGPPPGTTTGNGSMAGASGAPAGAGGTAPMGEAGSAAGDSGVPATEHCAAVANWDPMWTQFEEEVLALTNEARAQGATCGNEGSFPAAEPLVMNAELRCSARLHSQDMGEAGYFAHDSQNGDDPFDRMSAAGYQGRLMGENIAKGQQSPAEVVNGWMNSPGHCSNIMNGGYTEIGVGYWEGAGSQFFNGNKLWTQNFGASSSGGGGSCPFGPPWC